MHSRRIAKASEAVREVVSSTILFQLRDPRIQHVTVLHAEVAPDMRTAKVYVSVMGDPKQQSLTMHGLESARGFIQSKIAERLDTRYTPVLKFVLDQGVKRSIEVSRVLRETLDGDASADSSAAEGEPPDAETGEIAAERADSNDSLNED
ncbi:MAG: 30S ribosome-binding factor RbfA [Planctomycetaceae bacterium]